MATNPVPRIVFPEIATKKKPFEKLTVVFKRITRGERRGGLTAHVLQGGELGSNIMGQAFLSKVDSAKTIVKYLLERMTNNIEFVGPED